MIFWQYNGRFIKGGRENYLLLNEDGDGGIGTKTLGEEYGYLCWLCTNFLELIDMVMIVDVVHLEAMDVGGYILHITQ